MFIAPPGQLMLVPYHHSLAATSEELRIIRAALHKYMVMRPEDKATRTMLVQLDQVL